MNEPVKRMILLIGMLLLCVVWGRNLVLHGDASPNVVDKSSTAELAAEGRHTYETNGDEYQAGNRDPFSISATRRRGAAPRATRSPRQPESTPGPQASYQGMVWNKSKPQVIVFDSLGSTTRIVGQGETINGFLVTEISPDRVIFESGRNKTIWNHEELSK